MIPSRTYLWLLGTQNASGATVRLLDAPRGTYHAHDFDADHPALCLVCERPATDGVYCGAKCRAIIEGPKRQ